MLYQATGSGFPVKKKVLRVDFTQDQWQQIARANSRMKVRMAVACVILGLAGIMLALFGSVTGIWKWILLAAGVLMALFAIPNKVGIGLNAAGEILDRAALDRFVTDKLKAYCKKDMRNPSVEALSKDAAPEDSAEDVPLSALLGETAPGAGKSWLLALAVMPVVAGIYFLIWRANVAGGLAGFLGVAACVLAGAFLLGWGLGDTAASRRAALVVCLFLALIGATQIYTRLVLAPAALKAAYSSETSETPAGARRGLLIVRESQDHDPKLLYMPLCNPNQCETIAVAGVDRLVDSASYGNTGRAHGYAYGCDVQIYDGATRENLGAVFVECQLPDALTGGSGDYEARPSDGQIISEVRAWEKENGR